MRNNLYKTYSVGIQFRNGLAGGTPVTPNMAQEYAERYSERAKNALDHGRKTEGEVSQEAINKYLANLTSIFPLDEVGPFVHGYQVTAMLRDALAVSKLNYRKNCTFLRFMIQNGGIKLPERIYLDSELDFVERPVSPEIKGRRQSSFAHFQVARNAHLEFPIGVIKNDEVSSRMLKTLLECGEEVGLGAFRHLGYGKFDLVKLEPASVT